MEISIIDDCWCLLTDNDGHWGKKKPKQNKNTTKPAKNKPEKKTSAKL